MSKSKIREVARPHAEQYEMIRLSENGDGFIVWGHTTHHDWETVQQPGYFRAARIKTRLNRHDRIHVTCGSLTDQPSHGELVVTHSTASGEISTAVLHGPVQVEALVDSPFDVLGLSDNAPDGDIESAFRKLSKKVHPDAGGDVKSFERLVWAREEALKRRKAA